MITMTSSVSPSVFNHFGHSNTDHEAPCLQALQFGKSWFPQQAGSGLDRYYYELTRHLKSAHVEVHGLVAGSALQDDASQYTVEAFAPDTAPLLSRLWAIRQAVCRLLARRQFNVVVSHFALYTLPILDLVRDLPLVVHFHGPWAHEGQVEGDGRLWKWIKFHLERLVYRRGIRFIVLSKAFRTILHTDYGVPNDRIDVIPGGVDLDRFDLSINQQEARQRLGWPQEVPILLSVRRLAERMGLDHLIDAFAQVLQRLPEAKLYLAGHGPLADRLATQVKNAGLQNSIRFLGFVPDADLPYAYAGATLSVVPTRTLEGFGLITVESLASGTPVMVTPIGGLPEVVSDLSPALVFPDGSPSTMADRLVNALTGRIVLPSSADCKAYARRRHDWHVIAQKVRQSYDVAIQNFSSYN